MPINDAFMLPKRVRTMEQMADLLQTEQTELTQTQRTIAALEQQLNISTSTFLLPRHERLFELPVNTTESLEARRAKVLAKLNTRGTTTVEAIREMVSIVTGSEGAVVEHFSQYAFNGALYKCVQDHTSQAEWTPDTASSLWAGTSDPAEEWPAWSQPVGAHDAYSSGAKVSHNGKHWISSVDNNVWEPGVYGWTEQEE